MYQARDTKLDRDVALKVLPQAFTEDPDRLARFEREAKVLASLNHPNIGGIHGLEESDGIRAIVLELVEGPTLANRIAQGPIPLDEALPIAKQIAEALEAAHEQGVIHRDLKPANIKVREDGMVIVLDFGLAKAFQPDASEISASMSPTISLTAAATQLGMVIGTAAYMAPEQAGGKVVDKRADVWAFGVVLYEMLTGTRPFVGDDVSKTLARVIDRDPDWSTLPKDLSPALSSFLRGCLEKNPKKRVRDIGDVILAMAGAFETTVGVPAEPSAAAQLQAWQRPTAVALIALCTASVAGLGVWAMMRPEPIPSPVLARFEIVPPDTAPLTVAGNSPREIAISPDGTQVVYRTGRASEVQLYLRRIDQLDVARLRGAEGVSPFFSPNGEWVGLVGLQGNTMLQKVSIIGGPPVTLTDSPSQIMGASWGADDQIVFGTTGNGLLRVSGGGGEPEPLTTVDTDEREAHIWPSIIPGRDAVVFVTSTGAPLTNGQLAVLDLNTGDVTRLGLGGVNPHYVSTGHLVYAAEDASLRAVPFDAASLQITGDPVPLVEGVVVKIGGAANFSIADNGSLVYVPRSAGGSDVVTLTWVDRDGNEEAIPAPPRAYGHPRVSPDGTRVAVDITVGFNSDVWIWDLEGETLRQFTFDEAVDDFPLWTPDSARVVFQSSREDGGLFWRAADGTGQVEKLKDGAARPYAWAADGQLLFEQANAIGVLTMEGERPVEMLLEHAKEPAVSADGRWLAYVSIEAAARTFVHPFPDIGGGEWVVSTEVSVNPLWSPDGRELFYRARDAGMMVVPVETEPTFSYRTPEPLFSQSGYKVSGNVSGSRRLDLAPDGRFIMLKPVTAEQPSDEPFGGFIFVENWFEELTERVPVP